MGRVYEGHHTGIGKRVAIKIAHQVERRKSEVAKRFQREALAPAQIGHPNVADVTDCGTTPTGEFFFVMEFIDGVSLDAVIKRDGQLTIERALTIATQICRALEAAHRAGIIHRDLKPSNVMLVRSQDQEELVKVLDFGVAKFLHDTGDGANLTLTDATVGTPKYMAPEQIRGGGKVDFRADIYALGTILYTMLAGGRMPIEGTTVDEIWQRKLTRDPRPLHEYRSDLPTDLEELILACLARDAAERPSSAEDLKKQLLAHLETIRAMGDSIAGMKSPSKTEVLSERMRRRRARLGIALGALTAVTIAMTGMYFIHWPFSRPRVGPTLAPAPPSRSANSPTQRSVGEAAQPPAPSATKPPAAESNQPPAQAKTQRQTAETASPSQATAQEPARVPPSVAEPHPAAPAPATPASAAEPKRTARSATAKTEPTAEHEGSVEGSADGTATLAIAKAETAFSSGRLATARISATLAIEAARKATPSLKVRAFVILGKVQLASEEFTEAERSFDRALAIDPNHPVARKGKDRAKDAAAKAAP
jgi:serine/threonine-protein kinase